MLCIHVGVARPTYGESLHAHPTNVNLATTTNNMIATVGFLHSGLTLRTVFVATGELQLLQSLQPPRGGVFVFCASHILMGNMARFADRNYTLWTGGDRGGILGSVYLVAVWRWAVTEDMRPATNVGGE
jgi:hypothetical protein